ncbi:MAG: hypothetical protein SPD42_02705 [Eubacteriales bacterium]|nr:hypothetical protein [Eubacteriales bacterium]
MEDFKDEFNKTDELASEETASVLKKEDLAALDEAEKTLEEEVDIDPFYNQLKSIVISKPKNKVVSEDDFQIFPDETIEALSNSPKGRRSNDKLKKEKEDLERANKKPESSIFKKLPKEKEEKKKEEPKPAKEKKRKSEKLAKQALAMSAYDSHFSLQDDKKKLKEEAKAEKLAAKEREKAEKQNLKLQKQDKKKFNVGVFDLTDEQKAEKDLQIRNDALNIAPVMNTPQQVSETNKDESPNNVDLDLFNIAPLRKNAESDDNQTAHNATENEAALNQHTGDSLEQENTQAAKEPKLDLGVGTCVAFDTHGESIEDIAYNNMYVPAEIVYDEFGNPDIVQTMNVLVFDRGTSGEIAPTVDTTAKIVRHVDERTESAVINEEPKDLDVKPQETVNVVEEPAQSAAHDETPLDMSNWLSGVGSADEEPSLIAATNEDAQSSTIETQVAEESETVQTETAQNADNVNVEAEEKPLDMNAWLSGAGTLADEKPAAAMEEEQAIQAETETTPQTDDAGVVLEQNVFENKEIQSSNENHVENDEAENLATEAENTLVEKRAENSGASGENEEKLVMSYLDDEANSSIIKTESAEMAVEVPLCTQKVEPEKAEPTIVKLEEQENKDGDELVMQSFHDELAGYEKAINESSKAAQEHKEQESEKTEEISAAEKAAALKEETATEVAKNKIERIISGEDDDSNWRNVGDKVDENGVVIAPHLAKLAKLPQIIDYFISLNLKRDSYVKIANFLTMAYKKFEKSPENLAYIETSIKKIIPCLMSK